MTKAKKHLLLTIPVLLIGLSALILTLTFLGLRASLPKAGIIINANEFAIESLEPRAIRLDKVSVKSHPVDGYCGISTVTVMSNFYNNTDLEPADLIAKYNTTGSKDMLECLEGELPGKIISYKSNVSNEEMLRDIHTSLCNGNPVVITFGAPNPFNEPYYDFHGSVVCGIDLDNQTITIANVYGYVEEISFADFLNRTSYTEIEKYPIVQQFVLVLTNWQDKNAYILVE